MPPIIDAALYPRDRRSFVAVKERFPERQYTTTGLSLGIFWEDRSQVDRGHRSAPSIYPAFHSRSSRQSTKVNFPECRCSFTQLREISCELFV